MTNLYELEWENIHSHSHYSNIMTPDSVIKTEDLAKRAVAMGQKTISTVEHGYFGSIFDYYETAQEYGLKLIFGIEYYFVKDRFEKDRTNSHLLVVAKNEEGRREMTSIMSEANKTGFFYHPRIDEELLFSLTPENVIATTACLSSPLNNYSEDEAMRFLSKAKEHFGDNFYIEVQPHTNIKQVEFQRKILKYNKTFGFPLILGVDSHYIKLEDDKTRDLFLKGKNIHYPAEDGFTMDYPDITDIVKRLKLQGVLTDAQIEEAITNTLVVRDFEGVSLNKEIKMPSLYSGKSHEEKIKILKGLINEKWEEDRKEIPEEKWGEYIEAIREEIEIIEETRMEDYFLLNHAIIEKAVNEYGGVITSTGRGSAPSFYVNKLLGLTDIDRVSAPITLYPTRFMSKSRILETRSLPDIDFNLADPEPFRKASKDLMGDDNSEWMVAYGTMQESSAFKNYARSVGINYNEANQVSDDLDRYKNDKRWSEVIEASSVFRGVIDSVAPHPCAHLLLPIANTSETTGTIKVKDEFVTLITSNESDDYKYLKNDLLSVTVWDIISKTYDMIGKPRHTIRELERLVEGDDNVWKLYRDGIVATLNQTGTKSGKPQVMQYKPTSVAELSMWVASIRPGFASLKQEFFNRKEHKYGIDSLDAVLSETNGYMIFQENIMAVLMYAGISEDRTYSIIKGISKKVPSIVDSAKEEFYTGFLKRTAEEGYDEEFSRDVADEVWKVMEDASDYSFNASHAYSVALDSVYGAYLKAYYPLEYYTVILNIYQNDSDKIAEIEQELDYFGIKIGPIVFGGSRANYTPDKETNTIFKGIWSVKFMNERISEELFELSQTEPYLNKEKDALDLFLDLIENTSVNSRQTEILINLDFFAEFGKAEFLLNLWNTMNNKGMPELVDEKYADKKANPIFYSKNHIDKTKAKRIENLRGYVELLEENPPAERTTYEKIMYEKEFIGHATTTFLELPPSYVLITDLNLKYTPILEVYQLSTGKTFDVKIKKNKFYDTYDNPIVFRGNIIRIIDSHREYGKKLVDGKWYDNKSVTWMFIDKMSIITG